MAKNNIETVTDVSATGTDQDYKEVTGTDSGSKRLLDVNVAAGGVTNNTIDSGNSTTAVLGIAGVFTGVWLDVTKYHAVSVQVDSDVDAAALGVSIQTSVDGVNADHAHAYDYEATGGEGHWGEDLVAQYYRIVYTNGSTGQAHFRMQAKLLVGAVTDHTHPLDHGISLTHPAKLVRSVIAGETSGGGGGFVNVKVNPSGSLTVEATSDTADDLLTNANLQVADVDVGAGNPVPVSGPLTDTELRATPVPISGTVTANAGTDLNTSALATSANQLPDGHNVTVDNASIPITAASLPLPAGAATSAAQLADGHNVDNAPKDMATVSETRSTVSTSNITILAVNAGRKYGFGTNSGSSDIYIALTTPAAASGANIGHVVKPGGSFSLPPGYAGAVFGISDLVSSVQNIIVTEVEA